MDMTLQTDEEPVDVGDTGSWQKARSPALQRAKD